MSNACSFLRIIGLLSVVGVAYSLASVEATWAQPQATNQPEPAPPTDQQYIGTKQCAACHFEQFMKWKATKHATSFDLLPAQYQADTNCLACHTTGFGAATGFKTAAESADLKGTSCEACHGPGGKHAEVAKQFANQKLSPEQEKEVRDSIWKVMPGNVCIRCHTVQGHHESSTPPELRKPG